jgi:hypothetical protein
MRKPILFIAAGAFFALAGFAVTPMNRWDSDAHFSDSEAGFEEPEEVLDSADIGIPEILDPSSSTTEILDVLPTGPGRYQGWSRYWQEFTAEEERLYGSWKRPPGPARVGIQAGHWKVSDAPEELAALRTSTGAYGGGTSEQKIVLAIAEEVKELLEAEGVRVDLLPATIPVDYSADAFVSVHADGNNSPNVDGFKITGPRRDFSGGADALVQALYKTYEDATKLDRDPNVTRRMSGYYAFNWRRYDHAVHPMTPAVIVETGFVTSPKDRAVILSDPERAAKGIADGIIAFLRTRGL